MDFYKIAERYPKRDLVEIYPDFKVCRSKDLMVRGKSFYAIWDEAAGLWSTDEYDVARIIDEELMKYYEENKTKWTGCRVVVKYMSSYSSKSWVEFKNYISKVSDVSKQLDTKICFSNTPINKKDYCSRRLGYSLEDGKCPAYEEVMNTLYSEDERKKLEWAIGAIIAGDSKNIQKFIVLYGDPGTGKSTILEIIQKMFDGYYSIFEAKALTSSHNVFSTEQFKANPLIAIQHDGDLSKIEDNSKLNSIVSHEEIVINEKYKSSYPMRVNCFLFMATNKPVKITDGKAGLIRRLIDVRPTGEKIEVGRYYELRDKIDFELGAIANHCLNVYLSMGKDYYNRYRPVDMMYKTDPFFNFVEDHYEEFSKDDGTSLKQAYGMYKQYCDDTNAGYKLQMYVFREELKNYFKKFDDTIKIDGVQVRSYYSGFLKNKFDRTNIKTISVKKDDISSWIHLKEQKSLLDDICKDCKAQEANAEEKPSKKWDNVKTTLADICTSNVHYVMLPENHIVIDFDIKDESGKKSLAKNVEAASKWPSTYAETSKSGGGLHLHYLYSGNVNELSRVYDDNIEIKIFTGNSSLRRKLGKCNDISIATINSGLPLKKGDKMVNFDAIKSEKGLRTLIKKNLNKEIHPGTKPSIDFIFKILEDFYKSGNYYDVTDLRPAILAFAAGSTNQSDYCIKLVNKMHFCSDDISKQDKNYDDLPLIFYDVEVFPNLFLVNWKFRGKENKVVRMINPTSNDIEELCAKGRLVGFNCKRYDNHIMYARIMKYSNMQLYTLSQRIINSGKKGSGEKNCFFGEAYNLSYTDIYDYAAKKQSLKKWEIELGIHHQELGLPWDEPVPEELWIKVAEYCDNDVIATEAVWDATAGDFVAREILAELADGTVNDATNSLTTKIIFKNNRRPQNEFCYRDLSKPVYELDDEVLIFLKETFPEMMAQRHGEAKSLLPYFDGYSFENGVSTYKGYEVGEGGFVWANPGMYWDALTDDVASMHPHSAMAECLFGPEYTRAFRDIVYGRVDIKHEAWDKMDNFLDGKLLPFIERVKKGEITSKQLANALKIAINSVYGLTAAKFENPFRDIRNKDNIVAKRGALFMIDLKEEVEKRGGTVIHIKTDSIKLHNPTADIQKFVMDFGKLYGYTFEIEHKFEKICLVNNAVYIAKLASDDEEWLADCKKAKDKNKAEPTRWTATGAQFAHPYIFKTLFSKENIEFEDMCETKEVNGSLYLDMNEALPDVTEYEKEQTERLKGKLTNNPNTRSIDDIELAKIIESGHNYKFVGKIGSFVPIKPGKSGGELLREKDGKYSAATGTKGYRWLESETVKTLGLEDDVDISYYRELTDNAIASINEFGDFEIFAE